MNQLLQDTLHAQYLTENLSMNIETGLLIHCQISLWQRLYRYKPVQAPSHQSTMNLSQNYE